MFIGKFDCLTEYMQRQEKILYRHGHIMHQSGQKRNMI